MHPAPLRPMRGLRATTAFATIVFTSIAFATAPVAPVAAWSEATR